MQGYTATLVSWRRWGAGVHRYPGELEDVGRSYPGELEEVGRRGTPLPW